MNMMSAENAPDGVNLASARTWPLTSISTTPDAKICIAGKNAIKIKDRLSPDKIIMQWLEVLNKQQKIDMH